MKQNLSKDNILERIKTTFPNTVVMFAYYCGSIAYGLEDDESDIDVTVVLDHFQGNVHLSLGTLDLFAYGRDIFLLKQQLHSSVPLYDRAYIDEILSSRENLIYLDERYQKEYEAYRTIDLERNIVRYLEGFIEHYHMRLAYPDPQKSHYHIFRLRGILERMEVTNRYELSVPEPWKTMMLDYKRNWNQERAKAYLPLLRETLGFIEQFKEKRNTDELG